MAKFVKVAARADIPVGGKKLVEIDGVAVAVFNVNGSFYAIEDVCTHDGGNAGLGQDDREELPEKKMIEKESESHANA